MTLEESHDLTRKDAEEKPPDYLPDGSSTPERPPGILRINLFPNARLPRWVILIALLLKSSWQKLNPQDKSIAKGFFLGLPLIILGLTMIYLHGMFAGIVPILAGCLSIRVGYNQPYIESDKEAANPFEDGSRIAKPGQPTVSRTKVPPLVEPAAKQSKVNPSTQLPESQENIPVGMLLVGFIILNLLIIGAGVRAVYKGGKDTSYVLEKDDRGFVRCHIESDWLGIQIPSQDYDQINDVYVDKDCSEYEDDDHMWCKYEVVVATPEGKTETLVSYDDPHLADSLSDQIELLLKGLRQESIRDQTRGSRSGMLMGIVVLVLMALYMRYAIKTVHAEVIEKAVASEPEP